jgi:hypothetical protein
VSVSAGQENESARSYAWLTHSLGLSDDTGLVAEAWRQVRESMRPVDQNVHFLTDWISDPWLARGVKDTSSTTVAPTWDPPDRLDEWPAFGVDRLVAALSTQARRTRVQALPDRFTSPPNGSADDANAAIARFVQIESDIQRHGDARMIQVNHLRAWLGTSIGPLLRGIMLSDGVDPDVLTQAVMTRLTLPFSIDVPHKWLFADELEGRRLDLLYNLTTDPAGRLRWLDAADIRVGQGEVWRENWAWLSGDIGFAEMREAVQLTAQIMRCGPVVEGLMRALSCERPELRTSALAIVRRWLLALKSMSWLEASALESWSHVRAQDLACFAFSALKPEWPRRIMAVSHRSPDVKPVLSTMRLWHSSRCAIDASYVPSWETNTGMIWSLFGATPAIVRVRSPRYADSVWCLREAELIEHLAERRDFASNRWVLDIDVSHLHSLDGAYAVWDPDPAGEPAPAYEPGPFLEFPPLVQVWTPPPMPVWHVAMLRAGAAVRAINVMLGDHELTNEVVGLLLRDPDLRGPAPTNNPTGIQEYARIFGELQAQLGDAIEEVAIRLPPSYGGDQAQLDGELLERVPDLSSGAPALRDVLVALEFLRTDWPIMVDAGNGRFLALNCRGLSRELLLEHEAFSLYRGLLTVRLPVPLWIIQSAGQGMENWDLPGDFPIFTEYFERQFSWMMEGFVEPRHVQSHYPENSGLILSPALQQLCQEG